MDNNKPTRTQGGIVPIRQRLALDVGQFVQHEGLTYRIVQQIDFNSLLGSDVITGRKKLLPINELSSPPNPQVAKLDTRIDLDGIEDRDWRAAYERFEAIKPLLDQAPSIGREEVNKRALEVGVSPSTLYRWLSRYQAGFDPIDPDTFSRLGL